MEFLEYFAAAMLVAIGWRLGTVATNTATFTLNNWLTERAVRKWEREHPEEAEKAKAYREQMKAIQQVLVPGGVGDHGQYA